jgi:hypothetical protein
MKLFFQLIYIKSTNASSLHMSLFLPNIIVVHKPIRMIQNHKLAPNFNVVENIDYPHCNHQSKALQKEIQANSKKLHN